MIDSSFTFVRRYSDAIQKSANLVFDVLFLAAKSKPDVLDELGRISLVALSALGIAASVFTADQTYKYLHDWRTARQSGHKAVASLAFGNVLQGLGDLSMVGVGTAAAIEGILGKDEKQLILYQKVKYVAIALVVSSFVVNLLNFLMIRKTSDAVQNITEDQEKIAITPALTGVGEIPLIASQMRFTIDKDTLRKIITTLEETPPDSQAALLEIFEVAKKNVETQRTITFNSRVLLMGIGLLLLTAGKKFYTPNSLYAAIINLSISAGWAVQTLREKWNEYQQRAQLDEAAPQRLLADEETGEPHSESDCKQ